MVGLIPLIAVENLACATISRMPGFSKRLDWLMENRGDLARQISYMEPMERDAGKLFLLAIPSRERLERVLRANWSYSMSISTATPARAWVPTIKPAGQRSSRAAWKTGLGTNSVKYTSNLREIHALVSGERCQTSS